MKKFSILIAVLFLSGCVDPTTGRDPFGGIMAGSHSKAESMGGGKYFVEAHSRYDAINGAKSECASMGKSAIIESVDAPEGQFVMAIFTCNWLKLNPKVIPNVFLFGIYSELFYSLANFTIANF